MSKRSKQIAVLQMKTFKALGWYVLKHRKPVKASLHQYLRGEMFLNRRSVRRHYLDNDVEVSTVFLGIAITIDSNDNPLIFETAIITNDKFDIIGRCSTWREALRLHWCAVNFCKVNNKHG